MTTGRGVNPGRVAYGTNTFGGKLSSIVDEDGDRSESFLVADDLLPKWSLRDPRKTEEGTFCRRNDVADSVWPVIKF